MNTSDLLQELNGIAFAQKDPNAIIQELVAKFESETGRTLFPADPMRLLLLTFAYVLTQIRSNIDFAGKQNLLQYAQDGWIQEIGKLVGVTQLQAQPATTILEFTLSTTLPNATIIQQGTRVTAGNNIFFATTETVEIPPGQTSITVAAKCTETGTVGNGFFVGQLNRLVDVFPFHHSVQNITETQGGADIESIESLRARIQLAPEGFSVAGPAGAYEFHTKTANQLIADVAVYSPSAGTVEVVPLLANGELPTDSIIQEVKNVLYNDDVRPLTDYVIVRKPEVVNFDIDLTYWIARSNTVQSAAIQTAVNQALQQYILWQKSKIRRNINPSKLTEFIMRAGAKRVEIRSPEFLELERYQIGVANGYVNVLFGGLEDD